MSKRTLMGLLVLSLLFALMVPLVAHGQTRATLRYGSTGADVKVAQTKLKDWGYYWGQIDGVYGWRTLQALYTFQNKNGLMVDGIVGPRTWAALGESGAPLAGGTTAAKAPAPTQPAAPAPAPAAPAPAAGGGAPANDGNTGNTALRQSERDLLARLTSAEAKGEPYEGMVAVAAVILNRIKDPKFPNTLQAVVYETDAFEPVSNGTIYNPPSEAAVRAAQDAMNGFDPTDGALYFWNPATATSPWIWSRTITLRIGKHVFGK
ncbi:MAG TPA: spore cortex-lytic enzyme [Symbiobacteriaceae bacterium]|nr:spore cortex-lytic enzyme [Symbiobacteriaceae bacterium]